MKIIIWVCLNIRLLLVALIVVSCSSNMGIIAYSATYKDWIGGQPGVRGVNYNFKVIGDFSKKEKLDSIYIDGVKANSFIKFTKNDTVVFSVATTEVSYLQRSLDKEMNINNSNNISSVPKVALLYFSDIDGKVITLKFNKFNRKDTVFYK